MNAFYCALAAASIWGIVPILEKLGLGKVEPLTGLFFRCIGVIIGFLALGAFFVKPAAIRSTDLKSAAFLILGGFLASFAAQICFYHGLKAGNVSRVVPLSGSYPLISFLLGVILLGESVSAVRIAGVACIMAGIWLLR